MELVGIIKFFVLLIFLVFVLVGIKILSEYRMYGNKIFNLVHNGEDIDDKKNRLMIELKSMDTNAKIVVNNNFNSDFIVICSRGVYLISYLTYKGTVSGNKYEKYLDAGKSKVKNPFYFQEFDKKKLSDKINQNINKVVLLDEETLIKINDDSTLVCYFNNILRELLRQDVVYTNEEIDQINKLI